MIETICFSYAEVQPDPMEAVLHDHNYYMSESQLKAKLHDSIQREQNYNR